jgi:hypothetical protein
MTTRTILVLSLLTCSAPALATHPCTSPLILDLNGDGVQVYGVSAGVAFDIDGNGSPERLAWTNPYTEEGFLWLDLNHNQVVDDGSELFGTATLLPTGEPASNGFEALASYDGYDLGGNGDGVISNADEIWSHLRLWVDANQDGVSQPQESAPLSRWRVAAIPLDYTEADRVDGTGSWHRYQGRFLRRVKTLGGELLQLQVVEDVFFAFEDDE